MCGVSPRALMAPCLGIRPPPGVQPSPCVPFERVSIFPQSPGQVQSRAKGTMGLRARVAFSSTPSPPPPPPRDPAARTPRPRCPYPGRVDPPRPCSTSVPSPPAPRAPRPGGPTPAAPGAQLRATQSPAPPPRPPRSPSPNKSRFLSPQQIKDQEGVKNSFPGPGGGGAREKPGLWGRFDGECVGNPRNVAAPTAAAGRGAGRRARPPGPPRPQGPAPSHALSAPSSPLHRAPALSAPPSVRFLNFEFVFLLSLLIFLFTNPFHFHLLLRLCLCLFGPCCMCEFPGQGWNLRHSSDPSCRIDSAGSLTRCIARALLLLFVLSVFSSSVSSSVPLS